MRLEEQLGCIRLASRQQRGRATRHTRRVLVFVDREYVLTLCHRVNYRDQGVTCLARDSPVTSKATRVTWALAAAIKC